MGKGKNKILAKEGLEFLLEYKNKYNPKDERKLTQALRIYILSRAESEGLSYTQVEGLIGGIIGMMKKQELSLQMELKRKEYRDLYDLSSSSIEAQVIKAGISVSLKKDIEITETQTQAYSEVMNKAEEFKEQLKKEENSLKEALSEEQDMLSLIENSIT